jgi:hypothetical protein
LYANNLRFPNKDDSGSTVGTGDINSVGNHNPETGIPDMDVPCVKPVKDAGVDL